ncbi:hypothetical protein Glove_480g9 [Diversispora epigaea]|uniref:Uncharacterized protein n=1 Tax=Diversispora epigaea TaxID=1348612 RepID=A0A397GK59_9GLOM|nr:hypothetical protein Glove_480g9 [Diversispora epigaea]
MTSEVELLKQRIANLRIENTKPKQIIKQNRTTNNVSQSSVVQTSYLYAWLIGPIRSNGCVSWWKVLANIESSLSSSSSGSSLMLTLVIVSESD